MSMIQSVWSQSMYQFVDQKKKAILNHFAVEGDRALGEEMRG